MKKHYLKGLFVGVISVLLISCAGQQVQTTAPVFKPYTFQANQYEPKVDNFVVILDTSSSMSEKYNGQSKAEIAKDFLTATNQTLPELKYNGALRTFGHSSSLPDKSTASVYDVKAYSAAEFGAALKGVKGPSGTSSLPLAKAITAAGGDLKSTQGPIAVIIVSDGKDMDHAPVEAANALKGKFGDRLCIDTVQVGNDSDGKTFLEQIAGASGCGFSTPADSLATSSSLGSFIERVFLAKSAPKPAPIAAAPKPLDSDKDGVPDNLDQCPNTPLGATVDTRGCWTYAAKVLFDLNSAVVRSEAYPMLNDSVLILKKNPDLKVEIDGHADSTGAPEYNMTLSEKRAQAVKDFFVSRGIDAGRLTTKGFGITKPVASNKTKEGRAKNRRVELTPVQ